MSTRCWSKSIVQIWLKKKHFSFASWLNCFTPRRSLKLLRRMSTRLCIIDTGSILEKKSRKCPNLASGFGLCQAMRCQIGGSRITRLFSSLHTARSSSLAPNFEPLSAPMDLGASSVIGEIDHFLVRRVSSIFRSCLCWTSSQSVLIRTILQPVIFCE